MSNEEKKAIDFTKYLVNDYKKQLELIGKENKNYGYSDEEIDVIKYRNEQFEILLNLIEKQQKEIENLLKAYKQDEKIIQEMAEFIYGNDTIFYLPKDVNTKQEVINYFRKKCKQ